MSIRRNRQAGHRMTPEKMFEGLHEEDSVSVINDGDTIKSFCSKYSVDGKHVITYITHLKDIDIRKDITTIKILISEKTLQQ